MGTQRPNGGQIADVWERPNGMRKENGHLSSGRDLKMGLGDLTNVDNLVGVPADSESESHKTHETRERYTALR